MCRVLVCFFGLQIDREKRLDGRGGRVARRFGKFGGFGERRRNQQQRRRTVRRRRRWVLQWYGGGGLRGKTRRWRRFVRTTTIAVHSRTERQNREMAVELPESGEFATDVSAAAAVIRALWTRTRRIAVPIPSYPIFVTTVWAFSKIPSPSNVFFRPHWKKTIFFPRSTPCFPTPGVPKTKSTQRHALLAVWKIKINIIRLGGDTKEKRFSTDLLRKDEFQVKTFPVRNVLYESKIGFFLLTSKTIY